MSGVRQGARITLTEQSYGYVPDTAQGIIDYAKSIAVDAGTMKDGIVGIGYRPPTGYWFTNTYNRSTSNIYSEGSKVWEVTSYGKENNTFTFNFVLDYNNLGMLSLIYDGYEYNTDTSKTIKGIPYNHRFYIDKYRQHSFAVLTKMLYRVVGSSGTDETKLLVGCVINSATFNQSSNSGEINVTASGSYSQAFIIGEDLSDVDYSATDGDIVEFTCAKSPTTATPSTNGDWQTITNVESLSYNYTPSAGAVNTVCLPYATSYDMGQSKSTITIKGYSDSLEKWKLRAIAGGQEYPSNKVQQVGNAKIYSTLRKGMKPMSYIRLWSSDGEWNEYLADYSDFKSYNVLMEDIVINSYQWDDGRSGKISDNISGKQVKQSQLLIYNGSIDHAIINIAGNGAVTDPVANPTCSITLKERFPDYAYVHNKNNLIESCTSNGTYDGAFAKLTFGINNNVTEYNKAIELASDASFNNIITWSMTTNVYTGTNELSIGPNIGPANQYEIVNGTTYYARALMVRNDAVHGVHPTGSDILAVSDAIILTGYAPSTP